MPERTLHEELTALAITCIEGVNYVSRRDMLDAIAAHTPTDSPEATPLNKSEWDAEEAAREQSGKPCFICGKPRVAGSEWCVDHDGDTPPSEVATDEGCWCECHAELIADRDAGLSKDEIRTLGTRLAGVMDGQVDEVARWIAPTVERIIAARLASDTTPEATSATPTKGSGS